MPLHPTHWSFTSVFFLTFENDWSGSRSKRMWFWNFFFRFSQTISTSLNESATCLCQFSHLCIVGSALGTTQTVKANFKVGSTATIKNTALWVFYLPWPDFAAVVLIVDLANEFLWNCVLLRDWRSQKGHFCLPTVDWEPIHPLWLMVGVEINLSHESPIFFN